MIDWKQKLSSRKFWAMLIGVIISIAAIFGLPEATTQQIVGLITAISTLVIYVLAEGYVDAKRVESENTEIYLEDFMEDKE